MPNTPKRRSLEKVSRDPPQIGSPKFYCCSCGTAFSRQKGYFPVSHSPMYRGTGYLPFCAECMDNLFDTYKQELGSDRKAMRRICMKIDLYWNDIIYDMVERTAGVNSRVRNYIGKTNIVRFIDKSFDDTILEESAIEKKTTLQVDNISSVCLLENEELEEILEIPEEVMLFWGPGYTPKMYFELEERRIFWISKYPKGYNFDIGEEALLRQLCSLEIDINHDRAAGKSTDKNINTLNTLLGSSNLKPTQKKNEEADADLENMPLGVGIQKWEYNRPLPETQENMKDIRGTIKNITTWYLGHVCKMVGLKNSYCKMYEDEMDGLRVNHQEFEDDDDDTLLSELFGGTGSDGGT